MKELATAFACAVVVFGGMAFFRVKTPASGYRVETRAAEITPRPPPSFEATDAGTTRDLRALWANGAHLYAVGDRGTIAHMTDPRAGFVLEPSPTARDLWGIGGNDRAAYAVGRGGAIVRSAPAGWSLEESGVTADLFAVAADAAHVVAVGAGGVIVRRDGAWARAESGTTRDLRGAALTSFAAYAVGAGGTILRAIAVADGVIYAAGEGGVLVRCSDDEAGACAVDTSLHEDVSALATSGSTLFACGPAGLLVTRAQGAWGRFPSGTASDLLAMSTRLGVLYAAGREGALVSRALY